MTKQTVCKLCGKTFICNNGMWFTTCECIRLYPEELKVAQQKYDSECHLDKSRRAEIEQNSFFKETK